MDRIRCDKANTHDGDKTTTHSIEHIPHQKSKEKNLHGQERNVQIHLQLSQAISIEHRALDIVAVLQ